MKKKIIFARVIKKSDLVDEISYACAEEGYPSKGSNFSLRLESEEQSLLDMGWQKRYIVTPKIGAIYIDKWF